MPVTHRDWLRGRGISDAVLDEWRVHDFSGRIAIPVLGRGGELLFRKYRRSPNSDSGPKYSYDRGGKASLYGIHRLATLPHGSPLLVLEGELDVLRAWSDGVPAVTSTGGAMSFTEEMALAVSGFDVTLCFDLDDAGTHGMDRAISFLGAAKVATLPPWVGDHGDYTDYANGLLLKPGLPRWSVEERRYAPPIEPVSPSGHRYREVFEDGHGPSRDDVRARVDLVELVGQTVKLRVVGDRATGRCPFHDDRLASLSVDRKKGVWYCHAEGVGGDVFSFIMKRLDVPFREALEIAARL